LNFLKTGTYGKITQSDIHRQGVGKRSERSQDKAKMGEKPEFTHSK